MIIKDGYIHLPFLISFGHFFRAQKEGQKMKKNPIKVAIMATVTCCLMALVINSFFLKALNTSWKMSELTSEARYYQSVHSGDELTELEEGIATRRAELKHSDDAFVAWVANLHPIVKMVVVAGLGMLIVFLLKLAQREGLYAFRILRRKAQRHARATRRRALG